MMKKIPLLILCISLAVALSGQTKKAFKAAAEKAYAENNHYAALTYYNEVLEFDPNDKVALLRSATAARNFNAYAIAAEKYTHLIDSLGDSSDSTAIYYAAQMFQRLGQYDKATEYYDRYISEYGTETDSLNIRAQAEKESSVWASSKIKEVDEFTTLNRLESDVNSNYSDFGAFQVEDSIYYSSMRFLEENPEQKPARQFSKLLTQKGDDSSKPIDSDFNKINKSIANACFNSDKTKLIYTICDYISETELRCDLYSSVVRKDGTITDQNKLPNVINDSTFTTTHPSIVLDPVTGNEILYFSSNRPGGVGEMDIWYSIFDKKLGYSKPINLSSINTKMNDVTPFFHEPTSTLYFSSDGRLGLGGYDIFQSKYNGGMYGEPVMISAPTNSSYHDMYYNLSEDGREALFSSNREGASYIDNKLKACCFDVYKAEIDPLEMDLLALTYNQLTNEELHGVTVYLYNADNGKIIETITVDTSHEHIFTIEREKNYLLVGEKRGFLPDSLEFTTIGIKKAEPITQKLYLEPDGIVLDAFTFDADTKLPLNGVKIILEDLSDPTNDQIIKVNPENNDFHFLLEKDKTYKISAEKNGYSVVSEIIDTRGMTGLITKKLYLNPFNLGAYLPIALFFDNDEPDPDSKSTATDKVYGDLLRDYMARKKAFMEKYGKGAKGSTAQISIDRMEDFFEGDVRGGYDQFKIFMDGLIQELKSGKRIDMTIRGYASPRFDVKYNLVLAQRRINSVRNDMELYKNGVLAPYLSSKQLIITEISYGEELSPPDVSDNLYDERESIYSLIASKQRRVEVVSVISK